MDNKEFEIEEEAQNTKLPQVQLPLNFLALGEIGNDDVKVYIKQDVYKALEKFASSDTSKELGSIILGEYAEELGKTHIVISEYIEAKYTDASASTLTFTHETWDYVHKEHEKRYPEKKIIGWQHTHPNYGIFLSNYDIFIQENFFDMPFQVAYVIDPIQNIRGFFQWKNGKIEKLNGYYIYDDIGKPIKIQQKRIEKQSGKTSKLNKVLIAIASVLCLGCLILGGALISLKNNYREHFEKQDKIVSDINARLSEQQEIIEQQSGEISALEENFTKEIPDVPNKTAEEKIDSVYFTAYTVQYGDTISSICLENGIDYSANIQIIMAVNGIEDANKIYAGQNILLPSIHEQ